MEIKRASDAFSVDFSFMGTVAKIDSDFNPNQRTGSYIGLFQLSKAEFAKYGSGEITSHRDNAVAAAYKFASEAALFEWDRLYCVQDLCSMAPLANAASLMFVHHSASLSSA